MIAKLDHTMSEYLAWVQWWAYPWRSSHKSWESLNKYPEIDILSPTCGAAVCKLTGIVSCLPPSPHPAVLRLALASTEQFDLMVSLLQSTFIPASMGTLGESNDQWCLHLSKVLPPDMLPPDEDPLQLLRTWVKPDVWQRLRQRVLYERVLEMEKKEFSLQTSHNRLDMLWQAIAWRVTSRSNNTIPSNH